MVRDEQAVVERPCALDLFGTLLPEKLKTFAYLLDKRIYYKVASVNLSRNILLGYGERVGVLRKLSS